MNNANDEGFRARLRGDKMTDNPYRERTSDWKLWLEGWMDQNEHLNSRDEALASIGWFG